MNVKKFLEEKQIQHKIINLSAPVHTAIDVQRACNCSLPQVLKTLLFLTSETAVLAIVPGDRKVNSEKLKVLLQVADISMAKPNEVFELTGYKVGTVSPFIAAKYTVIIEDDILNLSSVIIGSGNPCDLIEISSRDLVANTSARIEKIAI